MTLGSTICIDLKPTRGGLVMNLVVFWSVTAEAISAKFHIKRLSAQSQHFSRRAPVLACKFEGRLNAEAFDQVRRLPHEILHGHPSHELGKLLDCAGKFAAAELFAPASPSFRPDRQAIAARPAAICRTGDN